MPPCRPASLGVKTANSAGATGKWGTRPDTPVFPHRHTATNCTSAFTMSLALQPTAGFCRDSCQRQQRPALPPWKSRRRSQAARAGREDAGWDGSASGGDGGSGREQELRRQARLLNELYFASPAAETHGDSAGAWFLRSWASCVQSLQPEAGQTSPSSPLPPAAPLPLSSQGCGGAPTWQLKCRNGTTGNPRPAAVAGAVGGAARQPRGASCPVRAPPPPPRALLQRHFLLWSRRQRHAPCVAPAGS